MGVELAARESNITFESALHAVRAVDAMPHVATPPELSFAARALALAPPVVQSTDDYADFFYQLPLDEDSCHQVGSVSLAFERIADEVPGLRYLGDEVLGQGTFSGSNWGQRLAYGIHYIYELNLAADEAVLSAADAAASPVLTAWLAIEPRRPLGSADTYTDDQHEVCITIERSVMRARHWDRTVKLVKVYMAHYDKRQRGSHVLMLGVRVCAGLGVLYVEAPKAISYIADWDAVLAFECTVERYTALLGFTQHVRFISSQRRGATFTLYHPWRTGFAQSNPQGVLSEAELTPQLLKIAREWRAHMAICPGAPITASVSSLSHLPRTSGGLRIMWRSDAATSCRAPGISGSMGPTRWIQALTPRQAELPITALEFTGHYGNASSFTHLCPPPIMVCSEIDALTSACVLHAEHSSSPLMQHVWSSLLEIPGYLELEPRHDSAHIWSNANPLDDFASRGEHDKLALLSAQMGLKINLIPTHSSTLRLLDELVTIHDLVLMPSPLSFASTALGPMRKRAKRRRKRGWMPSECFGAMGYDGEGPVRAADLAPRISSIPLLAPAFGSQRVDAPLRHWAEPPAQRARLDYDGTSIAYTPPVPSSMLQPTVPLRSDRPGAAPIVRPTSVDTASSTAAYSTAAQAPMLPSKTHAASGLRNLATAAVMTCVTLASPAGLGLHASCAGVIVCATSLASGIGHLRLGLVSSYSPDLGACAASFGYQSGHSPVAYEVPSSRQAALDLSAHGNHFASLLSRDPSPYALRPPRGLDALSDLCDAVYDDSFDNVRSSAKVCTHWRYWCSYCQQQGTPPVRPDAAALSAFERRRETTLAAGFLPWCLAHMRGRRGNARALPSSAYKVWLDVRKWHSERDITLVTSKLVGLTLKRLCRRHLIDYGATSLVPRRKEPIPRAVQLALVDPAKIPSGTRLGAYVIDWDRTTGRMFRAIIAVLGATGFRKSEVTLSAGQKFDRTCASRANLAWHLHGQHFAVPPPALLRCPLPGDMAVLTPPLSKSDQFGVTWGASPIYLHFHADGGPLSPFAALAAIELHDPPSHGQSREQCPLFSPDGVQPFGDSRLDAILRAALPRVTTAAIAATISWHSFRIYLACALLAAGVSRPTIQALCRWQTEESLMIYARLNPSDYANYLRRAVTADVSSMRTTSLAGLNLDDDAILHDIMAAGDFDAPATLTATVE